VDWNSSRIIYAVDVADRLREAASVLRMVPMGRHGFPAGPRSAMPDALVEFWEMWNGLSQEEAQERAAEINRTRSIPTPGQITRMDEALQWFYWVQPRDRKAVFARANKVSYRKISKFDGRSHEHIRTVWVRTCEEIAEKLSKGG